MSESPFDLPPERRVMDYAPTVEEKGLAQEAITSVSDSSGRVLTLDDVLAMAELPERTAYVCVKPSLMDKKDSILRDLSRLVDAEGKLLEEDDEVSLGDVSKAEQARGLNDQLKAVQVEIDASTWNVRFRGKSSDDMAEFNKVHMPKPDKNGNTDMKEYNNILMSETAIDPVLPLEKIRELRTKLGASAIADMIFASQSACAAGGYDPGK